MNFYDYSIKNIDGEKVDLASLRGKPALIVNTASQCGFTPQYSGLQKLYEDNSDQFHVLGFPCNQFGEQEPGTEDEIRQFCESNYGVTFPMFSKVEVKGDNQTDIYQYLTSETGDIPQWNFHKYVVDSLGNVVKSFGTKTTPDDDEMVELLKSLS